MQYEQADRASIKRRASNYGISLYPEDKKAREELNNAANTIIGNKDKIKLIEYNREKSQSYGKYSVGGEPTPVIGHPDKIKELTEWDKKKEEYKDKRRRKKKQE